MTISKTAAIRATTSVCSIHGRDTSWLVYGPHNVANLGGPATSVTADSYQSARLYATQWRARVVLQLMGLWSAEADGAINDYGFDKCEERTLEACISVGIRATNEAQELRALDTAEQC